MDPNWQRPLGHLVDHYQMHQQQMLPGWYVTRTYMNKVVLLVE
jgi:hypothetical protein